MGRGSTTSLEREREHDLELIAASVAVVAVEGLVEPARVADLGNYSNTEVIDELPAGTRIGFWGTHQSYLLYGSRLERSPRYLPLDEHASADAMISYLRAQAIGVIAVGPRTPFNESSPVWRWMAEKSGHFERLHGEDLRHDVFVYRLSWANQ